MNNNNIRYRVCVDNYHAQINHRDYATTEQTKEEAVEAIIKRFRDRIDDDISAQACSKFDFEADNDKWNAEYDRLWKEVTEDIAEHGYEDGNGHRYYVREEDYRAPFRVAKIRSWHGPDETWGWLADGRGDYIEYATVSDALADIKATPSGVYELSHNEASSPEYVIISSNDADWLDNDDQGKFDWDGCECKQGDSEGGCCGVCDDCVLHMRAQEIAYIREHAITED